VTSRWTTRLRLFAAVVILAAVGVWLAGNAWAGRQCIEGGAGGDLLGRSEGRVEVGDGVCRAIRDNGTVRTVPLSMWDWDGEALVIAVVGAGLVVASVATSRTRKRTDTA
jgi:hypothetical protein